MGDRSFADQVPRAGVQFGEDEQFVDGLEGNGVLPVGAFDLLGGAVVESAALRDDGRWRGVDVDQAAVVVLPWQVRPADPEVPCECRVACGECAGFLPFGPQGQCRGDSGDAWGEEFPAVYDQDDSAGFRFPDEATAAAWHERGSRLVGRAASALRLRPSFTLHVGERVFDG